MSSGMYFMSGFADDEYYSTSADTYDGGQDMTCGVAGMLGDIAGAAAIESVWGCYTATEEGWEFNKSNASMATAAGQIINTLVGDNGGAGTQTGANTAPAIPHTFAWRPVIIVITIDADGDVDLYLNGTLIDTDTLTVASEAALADVIYLGRAVDAAKPGTNWYVNAVFLEQTLLSATAIADMYTDFLNGRPLTTTDMDHVWYVEDAISGPLGAVGNTVDNWRSHTSGGVAAKVLATTTTDGVQVDYYENVWGL